MTGKGTRDRTGCMDCRRRKRRCDRGKPQCESCQKHNITCVYEELGQTSMSKIVLSVAEEHFIIPLESAANNSFVNTRSDEVALVCQHYANDTGCSMTPSTVGCDNQTLSQMQLLLAANPRWVPLSNPSAGTSEFGMLQYCMSQSRQVHLRQGTLALTFARDNEVISCSKVCVNDERNVFRTFVLPVILSHHGPLFSTVLALSAAELARRGLHDGVNYTAAAIQYKGEALVQLRSKVKEALSAEESLLTCVLLASLDIAEGSQPSWLMHLRGALAIMSKHGNSVSPDCASQVLQYFRFRYVLMKTTQHRDSVQNGERPREDILNDCDGAFQAFNMVSSRPETMQIVDPQIGCSVELLELINLITAASPAAARANAQNPSVASAGQDGPSLENRIRQLKCHAKGPDNGYLLKSAECFRLAAFIYLQLVVFDAPIRFPSMSTISQPLLDCLSEIIVEDQPRRSFPMWPLFIAGCVSCIDSHRKAVLDLFNLLDSKWPISNISTVVKAIQTIWQTRDLDDGKQPMVQHDWQYIIGKFGWKLSLS